MTATKTPATKMTEQQLHRAFLKLAPALPCPTSGLSKGQRRHLKEIERRGLTAYSDAKGWHLAPAGVIRFNTHHYLSAMRLKSKSVGPKADVGRELMGWSLRHRLGATDTSRTLSQRVGQVESFLQCNDSAIRFGGLPAAEAKMARAAMAEARFVLDALCATLEDATVGWDV